MSLFKLREIWSTQCGKNEYFHGGCLITGDILNQGFDCLIVGSQSGVLRIFQPEPDSESDAISYKPTDLLVETQLPNPILQIAIGKLIS